MAKKPKTDPTSGVSDQAEAARLAAEAQAKAETDAAAEAARLTAEAIAAADEKAEAKADADPVRDASAAGEQLGLTAISVMSKSERGRRRAGFGFTREPTLIATADLSVGRFAAIVSDPELIIRRVEIKAG